MQASLIRHERSKKERITTFLEKLFLNAALLRMYAKARPLISKHILWDVVELCVHYFSRAPSILSGVNKHSVSFEKNVVILNLERIYFS